MHNRQGTEAKGILPAHRQASSSIGDNWFMQRKKKWQHGMAKFPAGFILTE